VFPEDRERLAADFRKTLADGTVVPSEFRVRSPNGQTYWFEERGEIHRDAPGTISGITTVLRDITERRQVEEEIARLKAFYESILESIIDGVWVSDKDDVIHYANRGMGAIAGVPPGEIVGARVLADFAEATLEFFRPKYLEAKESLEPARYDAVPVVTPAGRQTHQSGWLVPRVRDGKFDGMICTVEDITERKAAEAREEAVLQRLQAFRAAVNQGPGVVFRWHIVPGEWPVEMVTENVEQFGYSADDLVSGRVSWPGITHPDDVPMLEAQVKEHLEQGAGEFHQQYRIITKSGEIRQIEDWNTVLTGPGGAPTHIQAIVMDVTERWEEERRRREIEERFHNLTEQSPNMIFINHGGRVVYANPACEQVMGYTREEFCAPDFDFLSLHAPESLELVRSRFERQMQGEELPPCEIALLTKDGKQVEVILSTRLVDYEGDKAIMGILTDITARRKAERLRIKHQNQLRHLAARLASAQDDEQRRIAEGLHDDVAQLLTACSIKMAVADKTSDPAEARGIHEEIDQLLRETNEKVRSLSFELSSSTLYRLGLAEAVHELCEAMRTRYGVSFQTRGPALSHKLDEPTATILFKAVRELLFNVVKHADVEEAWVRIAEDERGLKLTVEDHGKGFPEAWSGERLHAGHGLGLFGIRERLQDLGGKIEIDSTPNVRTEVTLRIPARRDGREKEMPTPPATQPATE